MNSNETSPDHEERAKHLPPRPCTEAGLAERLADRVSGEYKYCDPLGGWLHFDGCRFVPGETGLKYEALQAGRGIAFEAVSCADEERRGKLLKFAVASEKNGTLSGAIAIARDLPAFATTPDQYDADPWLLCVQNGTVDLRTGALHPHDARSLHTMVAGVAFDATATCPRWDSFLEEVQPDPDVRAFLRRFAGYCLTGITSERVLVVFHGAGRNGKSKIVDTLYHMLGDYACYPEHDLLLSSDKDRHTTGLADLRGKRLAGISEVDKGQKFDEARLKRLTGDEPITARRMHHDNVTFPMTAKMVLAVNDRPRVRGDSQAVWDRIREVPFTVRIPDDKLDPQLGTKLRAELPGVLNWAIAGCLEWQRNGLGTARAIVDATDAYRGESDDVLRFLSERYTRDPNAKLPRGELRAAFDAWAKDAGVFHAYNEKAWTSEVRGRLGDQWEGRAAEGRYWKLTARTNDTMTPDDI